MRETLQALINLQEIDREIFKVQEELKRLPAEKQSRQNELDKRVARHTEIKTAAMKLRTRIKEIEDLTTTQRQRMRKVENEAAGSRADMALLVAYQHEIRTLKRDIGEAEEEGLTLLSDAERLGQERAVLKAAVAELEKEFEQYASNVDKEAKQTMDRAQAMERERKQRGSSQLAPDVLGQYEKLLASREGQAMAELNGRVCQGCYVSVPNNIYVRRARSTELVPGPSCGRILDLPEA